MASSTELGKRLRRLRSKAGLSQAELAAPAYTHAYVSTIEAGKRTPSRDALQHFSNKLGVEVEELLTGRPHGLPNRLDLALHEGRRQVGAGRLEQARSVYQQVVTQAKRFQLRRHESKGLQGLALCAEVRGDLDEAIELYETSRAAAEDEPFTIQVDAIAGQARCLQMRGETVTALYLLERALETLHQQSLPDPGSLLRIHTSLVAAYFERGMYAKASASATEALLLAPHTQDPERLASMHVNVARVLLDEGKVEDAHDSLRRAEELYRELELQDNVAECHHARGYVLSRHGDLERARHELEQAAALSRELGSPLKEARSLTEIARTLRLESKLEAARDLAARSLELLENQDSIEVADARRELALCVADSDPGAALEHLQAVATVLERSEEHAEFAATCRIIGEILERQGDDSGAMEAYRRGILAVEERL